MAIQSFPQIITVTFPNTLNTSIGVGDSAFYTSSTPIGGFSIAGSIVFQFGVILSINSTTNTVDILWDGKWDDGAPANVNANPPTTMPVVWVVAPPTTNDFIVFAKDNTVNTSSLVGYYAEVEFVNRATDKAELFSVGSEVFESSK